MAALRTEPLDFAPTARFLAFAIDELAELGTSSGGLVCAAERRAALALFERFGAEPRAYPKGWRHDYAALDYSDLAWSSGRARSAALPPVSSQARVRDVGAEDDAPALAIENAGGIVHVGSTYLQPQRSRVDPRVTLLALADAQRSHAAGVAATHGRLLGARDDRFVALATAFQNCGAYVEIPSGVELDAPLQILWTPQPGSRAAVFAQTVVRVGEGARVTIVERYVGAGDSFVAATVEIDLSPGARLDYVVVDDADDGARIVTRRAVRCGSRSRFGAYTAHLGAALVRDTLDVRLNGDDASVDIAALFYARGYSHVDLDIASAHRGVRTTTHVVVRKAATDRARGRSFANLRVDADATETRATLRDDALLLSRDAYLEATPHLEVDASLVRIAQGANVGTLDEDALFYIGSRGISRRRAERMMALAFFEPAIERFPGESLRDEVRTLLDERLDAIPETFAQ